ncbi:MAG: ABC transporter substrate-binding protein [Alphaproteobacteria bacterium]|nr:ABC transporter substrate-binding protein [Alphaproteobacteria bacterium]
MTRYRVSRRAALGLGVAAGASVLVRLPGKTARAQTLEKLSFLTSWRAQAEHGGYYQAVAAGLYRKVGIDCEIRMGGPQVSGSQLLLGGRVDMLMGSGLEALNYVREDLPFLCIASIFQKDPQVLIAHANTGVEGFAQLKGRTILVGATGRVTYWPYLKAKFGLSDDQLRPYTFNLAPWLADKYLVQQGFISSEPYAMRLAGADPLPLLIADAGFDNYNTTIALSKKLATEKRDLVQRFVDATLEGWSQYLKGGAAIAEANALILKDNPEMTQDKIDYAIKVMNANGLVASGDALKLGIGAMTDARWADFYAKMADVGVVPKGLDASKAYSLDFVNKGIGKA